MNSNLTKQEHVWLTVYAATVAAGNSHMRCDYADKAAEEFDKRFPAVVEEEGRILPPKFTASCGLTPETVIAGRTYKHINFPGVVYLGTEAGVLVIIEPGNYANRGCVVAYSGTGDSFWDGFSGCEE